MTSEVDHQLSVLITGANGFIGRYLSEYLVEDCRFSVRKASRQPEDEYSSAFFLGMNSDYSSFLEDVDVVIHLAAVAHEKNMASDALMELNHDATVNLAKQAAAVGVKRFIFLSSIAVNGFSDSDAIKESSPVFPVDNYAFSKSSAEESLQALSEITPMQIVIVRSPMVYGIGAGGTFNQLLQFIDKGYPLPFRCISNKRSFVYVENIVDFLVNCIVGNSISGEILIVSDNEILSTSEFISSICDGFMLRRVELPVPPVFLKLLGRITGREEQIMRLTASLWVDSSHSKRLLGWEPPYSFREAVKRMADLRCEGVNF